MSYAYTNGDGVAVLLVNEPNGATEPISILDDAIRQIKSYLNDPIAGPNALIAALTAAVTPSGTLRTTAVSAVPTGWLSCDGSAVSRSTYATLFSAIGVTYGAGDASTTFNLPDARGRTLVGAGTGDAVGATAWAMAQKKGDEVHVLTTTQLAAHTHFELADVALSGSSVNVTNTNQMVRSSTSDPSSGDNSYIARGSATAATVGLSSSTGDGTAHNNLQPSLTVRVIIKT